MCSAILSLPDTDKLNSKHRSVLENERMSNKKVSERTQIQKDKYQYRQRAEMVQNILNETRINRKLNMKREQ